MTNHLADAHTSPQGIIARLTSVPAVFCLAQRVTTLNYRAFRRAFSEAPGFLMAGESYLEVACGPGEVFPIVRPYAVRYLGIDLSERYIAYARRRHPKGEFRVLNAQDLPSLGERFDRILAVGLFHHLGDHEAQKVVDGMAEVLAPGGLVFILDAIFPLSRRNVVGRFLREHDAGRHIRQAHAYREIFANRFSIHIQRIVSQFPHDYVVFLMGPGRWRHV